jgi:hypothetical protein
MSDASDTIKKRRAQAIYINQINSFVAERATNGVLSTCTTAPAATSTVTAKFQSFENKYLFFDGKNTCADCTCPVTGYAEH